MMRAEDLRHFIAHWGKLRRIVGRSSVWRGVGRIATSAGEKIAVDADGSDLGPVARVGLTTEKVFGSDPVRVYTARILPNGSQNGIEMKWY